MSAPVPLHTFDWRAFAKRVVMAAIKSERANPSECKARIMIAREHGHIDDDEAEEMIVLWGLEGA